MQDVLIAASYKTGLDFSLKATKYLNHMTICLEELRIYKMFQLILQWFEVVRLTKDTIYLAMLVHTIHCRPTNLNTVQFM